MEFWVLPNVDLRPLDKCFLDENGFLRPLSAAEYLKFPIESLQVWCVKRGIYQLPTIELLEWLKRFVGDKKAIEIGAGNGSIGRYLNIPMTDSYMQIRPEIKMYYENIGQTPIFPPGDVQKFEALEAVNYFKPDVVIGAWITQLYHLGDKSGSEFGVDEELLLKKVGCYITIGNDSSHGDKRINKLPHKKYNYSWLVSRARNQRLNNISVWER